MKCEVCDSNPANVCSDCAVKTYERVRRDYELRVKVLEEALARINICVQTDEFGAMSGTPFGDFIDYMCTKNITDSLKEKFKEKQNV